MTGTTIAQAIPVAATPILTRIYTPEDLGMLALFLAITSIFGTIVSGRYELAIMLPSKNDDAINILTLGLIITLFISFVIFVLIFILINYFPNLEYNNKFGLWLYFIPLSTLLIGIWNLLNYYNLRKKNYSDLKNTQIIKSTILIIISVCVGIIKSGVNVLISAEIISRLLANINLSKNIARDKFLLNKISKKKIKILSIKYIKFPKFDLMSALTNTASIQIPYLLIDFFFNTVVVGFFSLSHRFISMPVSLIGSSIGKVFFQQSSLIKKNEKKINILTLTTYKKLFKIGLIPFAILAGYGDYIFSFLFGSEWIIAGLYAQLLSVWIFFVFITSPISTLCLTLEKQKEGMIFNFCLLITRALSLIFSAIFFNDIYITILIFAVVSAALWMFWFFYLINLVKINLWNEFIYILKYVIPLLGFIFLLRNIII